MKLYAIYDVIHPVSK